MNEDRFINYLANLMENDLTTKVNTSWTVKDVIAHLVGWEKECAKVLPKAWQTKELPWFMETNNYDDFNAKSVAKFKDYPIKDLLNEWRKWQQVLNSEIEKIGKDKIRKTSGFDWVLNEGHNSHYNEHFLQIKKALLNIPSTSPK